jgi:aspartate racemase
MIGGTSWHSTAMYYEQINKGVARRKGAGASAPLLIESLDFEHYHHLQQVGDWDGVAEILVGSAQRLEQAGAEGLILCSNTAHKLYDRIDGDIRVPMIHVGDVTAARLEKDGVKRVGLIGTRFTMNESFFRERIETSGIAVSLPDAATQKEIDRIIFDELSRGMVSRVSQRTLKTCLTLMSQARQQGVILGCTELVMLVDPGATVLPVYDITKLHAEAAIEWILAEPAAKPEAREAATAQA